jgi:hypothetical protein
VVFQVKSDKKNAIREIEYALSRGGAIDICGSDDATPAGVTSVYVINN